MSVKIDTATPVTPVDDVIPTDQQRREGATLSNGRRGN
jgi:hypothetical protein